MKNTTKSVSNNSSKSTSRDERSQKNSSQNKQKSRSSDRFEERSNQRPSSRSASGRTASAHNSTRSSNSEEKRSDSRIKPSRGNHSNSLNFKESDSRKPNQKPQKSFIKQSATKKESSHQNSEGNLPKEHSPQNSKPHVEGEKLQKVLARAGMGSRREIESMISEGRISVDGKISTLGDRVTVTENIKIRVDGHIVSLKTPEQTICRVIAYYKPEGEICTRSDPEGRPTVYSRLPKIVNGRWIAVGRLDINTSGLLLFTNDGELANRLMHPSNQIEREYSVRVFGEVTDEIKRTVTTNVQLEDGPASFKRLAEAGGEGINKWYNVVLTEGRNREVRRIWEAVDLQVSRLIRIRYGDIQLPNRLPRGGWEELDLTSVNYLRELVQLSSETGTKLNLQKDKKRIKTGQIRRAVQRHTTAASNNRRRRIAQ